MNILFVNAYFFPETISFSHLEKDLLEGYIAQGHEISIICPVPTRGISCETAKKYSSIKNEELFNGKVHVKRFYAPKERHNVILRAFRYLWCNFREYQIGTKYKDIDLIFAVSTPPTQGLISSRLAKKLKCPFVYSLQDVFPDSLITTGITREGSLIWEIGKKVEERTYEGSNRIVVISESIKNNLIKKNVPFEKIVVIPNWVDTEKIKPVIKYNNQLYEQYGINPGKFTIVYAGNFGAAQGVDVVIKTAEMLMYHTEIQFVLFGGGLEYESCKKEVTKKRLTNVIINPLLPQERVSEVYSLGDVALITCKKGVGNSGMPSKLWTIMACNVPIIASFDVDSELAEVVRNANAGICIEPENSEKLTRAILDMYHQQHNKDKYHGRTYVEKNDSKELGVRKYNELIQSLIYPESDQRNESTNYQLC